MAQPKLLLDYLYDHEAKLANEIFLTQPTGGSGVVDYTWNETSVDVVTRLIRFHQALVTGFERGIK